MDKQQLAVFINDVGGFDEAAEILDVDEDLLIKAFSTERLTARESATIDRAFSEFILEPDEALEAGVDVDELEARTQELEEVVDILRQNGVEYQNSFTERVANGVVPLDKMDEALTLFGNLSATQTDRLFSIMYGEHTVTEIDADGLPRELSPEDATARFFDALHEDILAAGGFAEFDIWHPDGLEDSIFWAWFRATFYE